VLGSNLFNTLAVVGIAGSIHPFSVEPETLYRDMVVMSVLTVSLFLIGYGFRGRQGRVNRLEGGALLLIYAGYASWLFSTVLTVHT
jgi:cation:H+ antiporter